LTEAINETVDVGPGNFSVYTVKNELPVDGLVTAYKAGTKEKVDGRRTYGDTVYLSLPAGMYDLEVSALENSRLEPIFLDRVESFDDKIAHQTISFDGGKINLITLNNGEGWDCTSKVMRKDGKVVGGSRTYGRPQLIEVNPGTYDVRIEGMIMSGLETVYFFKDVVVESGKTTEISHSFITGKARIGARSGQTLVDATVNIKDKASGKSVAGGRTYTSESSNPKEYLLNPGVYEVVVKAVKKEMAGKSETFTIEVKQHETVEKIVNF
jgi:Ca-activated chloride channel family protein